MPYILDQAMFKDALKEGKEDFKSLQQKSWTSA
jgi:hypothetical protein